MKTDSQKARRLPLLLVVLLLPLLLAGAAAANGLRIVVSIPPYTDLLERLAGPDAEVAALLPPGASPHGFEPSPRAVASVEEADLVVLDGGVDAWMERLVASGAAFVPFHDAWAHFAARYGLDLLFEIEPFPGREPTARELARAIDAVRASGARAVFAETQLSERAARVLAAEAGVVVVALDPLGGVPGREGYEALLRYNAERVVGALSDE